MNILFLSTLIACAGGFIVLSYQSLARARGWPVGELFCNPLFQVIFGGLTVIGSAWVAYIDISFLSALGVLVGGFIIAFILSTIFKSLVQGVAVLLIVASYGFQFFI